VLNRIQPIVENKFLLHHISQCKIIQEPVIIADLKKKIKAQFDSIITNKLNSDSAEVWIFSNSVHR